MSVITSKETSVNPRCLIYNVFFFICISSLPVEFMHVFNYAQCLVLLCYKALSL